MEIRRYRQEDSNSVKNILKLYWNDPEFIEEVEDLLDNSECLFLVVQRDDDIVGFAGSQKLPDYFKPFSKGKNPIELYVIAVTEKRTGVGLKLKTALIEEAKKSGHDEILIFSPTTHDSSWKFHDTLGFEQVGKVTPPEDGEGLVWRKEI